MFLNTTSWHLHALQHLHVFKLHEFSTFMHPNYIFYNMAFMLHLLVAVSLLPLALGSLPFSSTLATDPATGQALYQLYWTFDNTQKTITFNVVVRTTGWVGFGLSPDGGMVGSDVVIGWIASDGSSHFHVSVYAARTHAVLCIAVRKYNVVYFLHLFHVGSLRQCQCSSSDRP